MAKAMGSNSVQLNITKRGKSRSIGMQPGLFFDVLHGLVSGLDIVECAIVQSVCFGPLGSRSLKRAARQVVAFENP